METGSSRPRPTVQHVDMDAFFASVEILERPELADVPVIVGGNSRRGVVASCNYEARRYGVHSAMSSARANALCPKAVFLKGDYGKYEHYSRKLIEVLTSFTPVVEAVSIDEAFIDVGGAGTLFGSPTEIASAIRAAIVTELKLTASVGAATTKHLAKLASEAAKPRATASGIDFGSGICVVEPAEEIAFLHALPVRAMWGVGPRLGEKLQRLGIESIRDLAHIDPRALAAAVGPHGARHLMNLAWNRDDREVVPVRRAKSIGHEQTFAHDLDTRADVHLHLVRLCDAVTSRMRKADKVGRTITVKIRYGDFTTITRSTTLDKATNSSQAVTAAVDAVVAKVDLGRGIRLLGVSVSNLSDVLHGDQASLEFARDDDEIERELDETVDEIRRRYGSAAVVPALLVRNGVARVLKPGDRQWGPNNDAEQ